MNKSFVTITEVEDFHRSTILHTKWSLFRISPACISGFEIFEASYHTHRFGRTLKAKVQRPRWKLVARLESLPTLHPGGRVPQIKDDGSFEKLPRAITGTRR